MQIMQHMNDACDRMEGRDNHRLRPVRHAAGVDHLQIRQVPAAAGSASSPASPTRATSPTATTCTCTEKIDAFDKLEIRSAVPGSSPPAARSAMWRCPTCRTTWRPFFSVMQLHLRQHHVRRAEHQERLLPGVRLSTAKSRSSKTNGKLVWELPQVRQPRSGQDERRTPHLRLHRHPVLEPGPHRGDPRPRAASVVPSACRPPEPLARREGLRHLRLRGVPKTRVPKCASPSRPREFEAPQALSAAYALPCRQKGFLRRWLAI